MKIFRVWGFGSLNVCGLAIGLFLAPGCAAVFPEMNTAVRAPEASVAEPPPSDDLYFIYFESATVPNRTRDGRVWNPDPFAKLILNGDDLLVTPVERSQRKPTWPSQKLANYRIGPKDKVVVELWDEDAILDVPICQKTIHNVRDLVDERAMDLECDSGARVKLHVEAARPLIGIGLYYELRGSDGVRVTRVVGQSPASRMGIGPGDRILAIQGESVMAMDALGIKSKINTYARTGLELDVWFKSGDRHKVTLLEGAMYPLHDDDLELPQTRSNP